MSSLNYLSSKPRFEILDGLRGVAALIVVAFHLFETYSPGFVYQTLNHGYLAVDFFFLLSGYVIGYAYDDRWGQMSRWDFFKRRLIRLHPLIIVGTLVGVIFFYFGDAPIFQSVMQTPWHKLILLAFFGSLMIPVPHAMDIRGWHEMYPLNGAAWSLYWEYIANLCYALFIRHFSKLGLAICAFVSALFTIDIALDIDVFGLLEIRRWPQYTVIGGFGLSPDQLYIGLARLMYPFFAGLLMSRMGIAVAIKGGFWWCSLFIAAVLVVPHIGGPEKMWMDGIYNAVAVLLLFPVIVALGAGSRVTDQRSLGICKFLGDISYPLYITHYPLIYMQMAWAAQHKDAPQSIHIIVGISLFLLSIAVAYASLRIYDEPVRKFLTQRFLIKK